MCGAQWVKLSLPKKCQEIRPGLQGQDCPTKMLSFTHPLVSILQHGSRGHLAWWRVVKTALHDIVCILHAHTQITSVKYLWLLGTTWSWNIMYHQHIFWLIFCQTKSILNVLRMTDTAIPWGSFVWKLGLALLSQGWKKTISCVWGQWQRTK